jgi:hypothetical protein
MKGKKPSNFHFGPNTYFNHQGERTAPLDMRFLPIVAA